MGNRKSGDKSLTSEELTKLKNSAEFEKGKKIARAFLRHEPAALDNKQYLSQVLAGKLTNPETNTIIQERFERVLTNAEQGCALADKAIRILYLWCKNYDHYIPEKLQKYISDELVEPRSKSWPRQYLAASGDLHKKRIIRWTIQRILENTTLKATRNEESKHRDIGSASDVIQVVYSEYFEGSEWEATTIMKYWSDGKKLGIDYRDKLWEKLGYHFKPLETEHLWWTGYYERDTEKPSEA